MYEIFNKMLENAEPFVGLCAGHGTNRTGTGNLLSCCNLMTVKRDTAFSFLNMWECPKWFFSPFTYYVRLSINAAYTYRVS